MPRLPSDDKDKVPGGGWVNPSGIPEPMASAIRASERGRPKPGTISVTELLQPPRIRTLTFRHWDDERMVFDVAHRMAAFIGISVHDRLARFGRRGGEKVEQRLSVACMGWTVTGQPDRYRELRWLDLDDAERAAVKAAFPLLTEAALTTTPIGVLDDHKTVMNGWSLLYDKPDWTDQLDLYAHLYRDRLRKPIHLGRNLWYVCYLDKREVAKGGKYPSAPAGKVIQALRPPEEARAFFEQRVSMHRRALLEDTPDGSLPLCSPAERWMKGDKWRVKKAPNAKRAVAGGVFKAEDGQTREDAEIFAAAQRAKAGKGSHFVVVDTIGESRRCQPAYCKAFAFCEWGQAERKRVEEAKNGNG